MTTVKAATHMQIQNRVVDLFGGRKNHKQLGVDGVGDTVLTLAAGVVALFTGGAVQLDGAAGDANPAIVTGAVPTSRKLWAKLRITSTNYARLYADGGGFQIVLNAAWNPGTLQWDFDDNTRSALRLRLDHQGTQGLGLQYQVAGPSFAESAWINSISLASTNSAVTFKGDAQARRVYVAGTALIAGDFIVGADWGNTAMLSNVSGDDSHGEVTVTANGAGILQTPHLVLTFHDGAWNAAPRVIAVLADTNDGTLTYAPIVTTTPTANIVTFALLGITPVAGKFYKIKWWTVG